MQSLFNAKNTLSNIIVQNLNVLPIVYQTYANVLRIDIQNNIYDIYIDIIDNGIYDVEYNNDIENITLFYTVNHLSDVFKLIDDITYHLKPHIDYINYTDS